jgi:hypothetical protein
MRSVVELREDHDVPRRAHGVSTKMHRRRYRAAADARARTDEVSPSRLLAWLVTLDEAIDSRS